LEQQRDLLHSEVSRADRKKATAEELRQKLENIAEEIEKLRAVIEELEDKVKETPAYNPPGPFARYKGPYILLECDAGGATMYPGKRRIVNEDLDGQTKWLKSQIKRTGAAALVARPDSFEESYSKFYAVLTELASREEAEGNKIVLSFWPIEANESIDRYAPKEN
jgi:hypothetical protein